VNIEFYQPVFFTDGFVNIYQNSDALPDYETQFLVPKQLANRYYYLYF